MELSLRTHKTESSSFTKLVVPRIEPETSLSSAHCANPWATEVVELLLVI